MAEKAIVEEMNLVDNESGKKRSSAKGKAPAEKTKEKRAVEPVAKTSDNFNDTVLAFIKNVQVSMKKQDEKLNKLVDRMDDVDRAMNEAYQYEDECYDSYSGEPEEYEDTCDNPSSKRKFDDNNNSRFAQMSKKFKTQEICDSAVDETLACNVNEFFKSGIDEERYNDLIKDDNNARPENCDSLVTVKTNQMIWDSLSSVARTNDRKLQNIETSVVKAATLLIKSVNEMANKEKEDEKFGFEIDRCNEVLALLGHANKQINLARRDFLKPEIKDDYVHLCNHSMPYTKELFGDDLSKTAKEIEDIARISNKINRNRFSRGSYTFRGQFRSRSRFRRYPARGRPYSHSGASSSTSHMYNSDAKNYQRRGASKPQQKY
ncbi:uncharacterized protein LOC132743578 [Ruditapes philippinarum]|uniref:uncharacterized protein LOC132743578 n=1 Tax=Ruditapes philippinarum TaxID=129788 RepID=UPI00295B6B93|nr:uncharacterized protein LOC132743578 [Ruditapes philippinarum]